MIDINSVVVSSRIRLARTLSDHVVPAKLSVKEGEKIIDDVADIIMPLGDYKLFTMEQLPALDAEIMQEKHLISAILRDNKENGAVILSDDETVSIMINEEDHIRAQCFLKGLSLDTAYKIINEIDDKLIEKLDIAYDNTYGFLTSCITNIGTGMRASVMLFLPALTMSGKIEEILNGLNGQGLTARGVFGEGSSASSFLYQISNARSLGVREQDIIAKVTNYSLKLCEMELEERKRLLQTDEVKLKDKVFRAWGILTNAYQLTADEFMRYMGELKTGIVLGFIRLKDNSLIDKLLFDALPSSLTKLSGYEALGETEENITRANFVSKTLKNARLK